MVINWTPQSKQDLHDFFIFTKKINKKNYISNLVKNVNQLINNPNIGRPFFYSNSYLIRKFIHEEHNILYFIDNETIHIIAIIHHKQDINAKIKFIKEIIKNLH